MTHEDCERYVDRLMQADEPGRLRLLWDMCEVALREDAPGFPIIVGIVLRDRRIFDWAEYAFQLALRVPGARHGALFELSVLESIRGRPERSITWLAEHEGERPLHAYGERAYAHQLARVGEREGVSSHLMASFSKEPNSLRECIWLQQWSDYLAEFPADDAMRRTRALNDTNPALSASEVAEEVLTALREERPFSVPRLNDGDGAFFVFSMQDEAKYSELYSRNRREWLRLIFGNEDRLYDAYWWRALLELPNVIANADILGVQHVHSIEGEYAWGSVRNVPCIFNIIRQLEISRDAGQLTAKFCSPQVNQSLLFEGHLERMLAAQSRLGVISCHSALPGALQRKFDLSEVFFHQTTGEAAVQGEEEESFESWHGRIAEELKSARPGVLYLVGAGPAGKMYCDIIKAAGGVALDIGAVADVWMKAPTREFHHDVASHGLAA